MSTMRFYWARLVCASHAVLPLRLWKNGAMAQPAKPSACPVEQL